ncbi:MAG: hypothetical protein ACTH7L_01875 [Psychrobacter alimentarius]
MRKLIIAGSSQTKKFLPFDIRPGLDLRLDQKREFDGMGNLTYSASANALRFRVSPDKKKFIGNNGSNTSNDINAWFWDITNSPVTFNKLTTPFPTGVFAVAVSNDFYAVGGASPFLYVFRSSDNGYVNINTASLGTVYDMSFNNDGTKLAVVHSVSPYLRVYNVSDWSYVNSPTATGVARSAVGFTADGNYIVAIGTGSPYLTVHNAATLAETQRETSSTFYPYNGARINNHPFDNNKVLIGCGPGSTNNRKSFYDYNVITKESIDILPTGSICSSFVYSEVDELFYVAHSTSLFEQDESLSIFNARTYARIGTLKGASYFEPNQYSELAIIERDLHKISGTVRSITNTPVARTISVHDRTQGYLIAKTISNATTGNYQIILPDSKEVDVQFHIENGELLNDLFYARVIPEPVA